MKVMTVAIVAAGLVALAASAATAQGKKAAKKPAETQCLNALACGPQPVPKMRKPAKEQFMRSAS